MQQKPWGGTELVSSSSARFYTNWSFACTKSWHFTEYVWFFWWFYFCRVTLFYILGVFSTSGQLELFSVCLRNNLWLDLVWLNLSPQGADVWLVWERVRCSPWLLNRLRSSKSCFGMDLCTLWPQNRQSNWSLSCVIEVHSSFALDPASFWTTLLKNLLGKIISNFHLE